MNLPTPLSTKIFLAREFEEFPGRDCSTFNAYPIQRMSSSQSLVCEAAYPGMIRRQSLCHLERIAYDAAMSQDLRLPPPVQRRRMSVASSRAVQAGSGRCHSSAGHRDPWVSRRSSIAHATDLMTDMTLPSSTRQRVWSEAGRSCDETTIRASMRNFRTGSEYLVPGYSTGRRHGTDELSMGPDEDLIDMSYSGTLLRECSMPSYESGSSTKKRKMSTLGTYDNASSLNTRRTDL